MFSLRGWSPRIQTECPPPYLGSTDGRGDGFRLRGCYPLWRPFPRPSTTHVLCNSLEEVQLPLPGPATPRQQRPHAVTLPRFRLAPVRSPLLRGSRLLSLPPGTEMFQFPGLPLPVLCVQTGVTRHDPRRVSPFGHPRIDRLVGSYPGLIAASYVLHRLLAPRHPPCALSNLATGKDARARYVVLKVPGLTWPPRLPGLRRRFGGQTESHATPPIPVRRPNSAVRGARRGYDAPSKLNSVCDRASEPLRRSSTRGRDRGRYQAVADGPDRIASDRLRSYQT